MNILEVVLIFNKREWEDDELKWVFMLGLTEPQAAVCFLLFTETVDDTINILSATLHLLLWFKGIILLQFPIMTIKNRIYYYILYLFNLKHWHGQHLIVQSTRRRSSEHFKDIWEKMQTWYQQILRASWGRRRRRRRRGHQQQAEWITQSDFHVVRCKVIYMFGLYLSVSVLPRKHCFQLI